MYLVSLLVLFALPASRGVTGIFFWGGKVIFPAFFPGVKWFFPVEIPILVDPKQIPVVLKSEKQKKNKTKQNKQQTKKKQGPHLFFITFPTSISNFPPSLLQFSFFSSQFSPLFPFFLASFFPIRPQKFPGQKSLGAFCPLLPLPVTPLPASDNKLLDPKPHNHLPFVKSLPFFSKVLLKCFTNMLWLDPACRNILSLV